MAVQQALEDAIHSIAPSAKINLEVVNGHLSGTVVAPEFAPLTHLDRQQSVWKVIRAQLGPESVQVGLLLLYSPEEAEAADEPSDEE